MQYMVGNKCIRENIRDPYLDFSQRLRVTFKLLLSSHSSKCVMSDFQAKNWPKFSLFDSDVSMKDSVLDSAI